MRMGGLSLGVGGLGSEAVGGGIPGTGRRGGVEERIPSRCALPDLRGERGARAVGGPVRVSFRTAGEPVAVRVSRYRRGRRQGGSHR